MSGIGLSTLSQHPGKVKQIIIWDPDSQSWVIRRWQRSICEPCIGGFKQVQNHTYSGYLVKMAQLEKQGAYTEFLIPDDFGSIIDAKTSYIAQITLENMTFLVSTNACTPGDVCNSKPGSTIITRTTVANTLYSDEISAALTQIEKGDCVGIRVNPSVEENSDAIFLGVSINYEVSIE